MRHVVVARREHHGRTMPHHATKRPREHRTRLVDPCDLRAVRGVRRRHRRAKLELQRVVGVTPKRHLYHGADHVAGGTDARL
ncbi:MAG: hypothetical protein ACK559_05490, partial [bacterium]